MLDVAGGSGNTALAAARCGCEVVSLDYVPSLLERARERAAAEGLAVEFVEGDAEALPFPDASFDAVVSVVGVMFAPDHERTAAELAARLPPRRHDRAGQLDPGRLHRRAVQDRPARTSLPRRG